QAGLSTADMEEAAVKRALMAAAGDTVVMASSEKLGAASPYVIAPLDAAATVLVAPEAPQAALTSLRKAGAVLVVA
ncbi:MAG: DeoR family transcriptional regulator, partial [Variovorax paradoxus]